jgi:hypothetical protein
MSESRKARVRARASREAEELKEIGKRLEALAEALPAPTPEELAAMEEGRAPLTLQAFRIALLHRVSYAVISASEELEGDMEFRRSFFERRWKEGKLPPARELANLRSALQGRSLPESFKPPFEGDWPETYLLYRSAVFHTPPAVGLVPDLLLKGYSWECWSYPRSGPPRIRLAAESVVWGLSSFLWELRRAAAAEADEVEPALGGVELEN